MSEIVILATADVAKRAAAEPRLVKIPASIPHLEELPNVPITEEYQNATAINKLVLVSY